MDIEITGGADGPTTIFLSAGPDFGFYIAAAVVVLLAAVAIYAIFRKRRK